MQARILVGILNWGLGHAARSIPVIRDYMARGYAPVIASDGLALDFLQQQFPGAVFEKLPALHIRYPRHPHLFPVFMAENALRNLKNIAAERRRVSELVQRYRPQMIYSDNRPFFRHPGVHSIYMTHQLQVPAGRFQKSASRLHHRWMDAFDEIFVPDYALPPGLSGRLGHPGENIPSVKYIGPLTRFDSKGDDIPLDWLLLLSGPEKQRTLLEKLLIRHQHLFGGRVCLVRGTDRITRLEYPAHWEVFDLLHGRALAARIRGAAKILSRSGYTSVMDWFLLRKKAVLIPTPGQGEQEYLARHLEKIRLFPFVEQAHLEQIAHIPYEQYYRFDALKPAYT